MKNRSALLLILSLLISLAGTAQERLWTDLSSTEQLTAKRQLQEGPWPGKKRLVKLNTSIAKQLQGMAPLENALTPFPVAAVRFGIPLPDGSMQSDVLIESPVLSPELQSRFPSIKTYRLRDEQSKKFTGRITISDLGISGILFTDSGAAYISPVSELGTDLHAIYYVKDVDIPLPLQCDVKEVIDNRPAVQSVVPAANTTGTDCKLRTYRVAVSVTGEYTQWAGGVNNAMTALTSTINEVNTIYERDLAIRFTIVSTYNSIYIDPATDPFPTASFPNVNLLNLNHNTLVSLLGNGGFDLGMVFNAGWNGGLAYLSTVCNSGYKGGNAAGLTFGTGGIPRGGPQGPIFTGVVAHEIGHQFGAAHSFAATNGSCNGNSNAATAWEPGGGSTIMAYAGSCTGNSYQHNTDLYFHGGSISQIKNFISTTGTCASLTDLLIAAPAVAVDASSYTIPPGTPFELRANATGVNAQLQYCWEQLNAGPLTSGRPSATATAGPQFRSYPPNSQPSRVFPNIQAILNNATPPYEVLPSVSRSMNFRVTVRDGASGPVCTDQADVQVNVAGSTPFKVTSQTSNTSWTANGSNTATITWDVANTNNAPVNCSEVDILFSSDGGYTYPYTLASRVPNNGTSEIIIPNLATVSGRIRVKAADNIFFDINDAAITIISGCTAGGSSIIPDNSVQAPVGDPALKLGLSPDYGTLLNSFTGQLTSTDPAAKLVFNNNSAGNCEQTVNVYNYDQFRFMVDKAGYYKFNIPAGTYPAVMNLYRNAFDPANPCNGFFHSNATRTPAGVTVVSSFTTALLPGVPYVLSFGTFNTNSPALPLNYSITATNDEGGSIYTSYPSPGAGFSYNYLIVDDATGLIKAVDASADLSNSNQFRQGSYSVYGLSFASTIPAGALNAYTGGSFDAFKQAIIDNPGNLCSSLSANVVKVIILGNKPMGLTPLVAGYRATGVYLRWGTHMEQGSSHFEIYRSSNGVDFLKLPTTVPAKGYTSSATSYNFTDRTPADGVSYYKVRQVNLDQQAVFTNTVVVQKTDREFVVRLRPNPVKQWLMLDYITEKREEVKILVTDSKGAVVVQTRWMTEVGMNTLEMDVKHLSKGLYFVKVQGSEGVLTDRFVKD